MVYYNQLSKVAEISGRRGFLILATNSVTPVALQFYLVIKKKKKKCRSKLILCNVNVM